MKKFIAFLSVLALLLSFSACGTQSEPAAEPSQEEPVTVPVRAETAPQEAVAVITVKDYGVIKVALDRQTAPITVDNFVKLVNEGFYDGLTFHRIISGFMIQGGDPTGTGFGGSDEEIKGEFKDNGVENPISHVRGTISMARSNLPDSASSQFFIVHQDSVFLDGAYAGFGHVIEGIEVVDAICENTPVADGNGSVEAADQPVIESIVIE